MPLVEPEMLLALTEPPSEANGTFAVTHAKRPNMMKLWVYESVPLCRSRLALPTTSDVSTEAFARTYA